MEEITAGFLIAGFVALLPGSLFNTVFLTDAPPAVRRLENVVVGPLIAVISFVCSVGNIPLAAVLWAGGISFAGVIAFIFRELDHAPDPPHQPQVRSRLRPQARWADAGGDGDRGPRRRPPLLTLEVVPQGRPSLESITDRGIAPNYTAVLNILFTLVGAALMWLTLRRGATDPVCGMRVDRYATEHTARLRNRTTYSARPTAARPSSVIPSATPTSSAARSDGGGGVC